MRHGGGSSGIGLEVNFTGTLHVLMETVSVVMAMDRVVRKGKGGGSRAP